MVLQPEASSFRFRNQSSCPSCGAINESSSWFCVNCNTILTKDVDILKKLQSRIRFGQQEMKQELRKKVSPSFINDLHSDEYFYSTLSKEQGDNFYGVTNKRLIKYKDGKYTEIPLSEIVGVYPPSAKVETSFLSYFAPLLSKPQVKLAFDVSTYHGIEKFDGIVGNPTMCGLFIGLVNKALSDYVSGKKFVAHVILDLPLE